jgi:phage shock protein PspC (stress-responsive transcriptional regulator)
VGLAGLVRSTGAKLARGGERTAPVGMAEMTAALKEVGKVDGPRLGPERSGAQPGFEGERTRPGFDERDSNARQGFDPDSHVYADQYSDGPRPRRLYRLSEGKMIAGVCAGLAAYLGIDVGLMRAIAVIAAVFTGFFLVVGVYVALMFLVPLARTSTEIAAARGALRSA